MLPKADPLPETEDQEELQRLLLNHFDGMSDMSFVAAIPGRSDDRLRRDEPRRKVAIRRGRPQVHAPEERYRSLLLPGRRQGSRQHRQALPGLETRRKHPDGAGRKNRQMLRQVIAGRSISHLQHGANSL